MRRSTIVLRTSSGIGSSISSSLLVSTPSSPPSSRCSSSRPLLRSLGLISKMLGLSGAAPTRKHFGRVRKQRGRARARQSQSATILGERRSARSLARLEEVDAAHPHRLLDVVPEARDVRRRVAHELRDLSVQLRDHHVGRRVLAQRLAFGARVDAAALGGGEPEQHVREAARVEVHERDLVPHARLERREDVEPAEPAHDLVDDEARHEPQHVVEVLEVDEPREERDDDGDLVVGLGEAVEHLCRCARRAGSSSRGVPQCFGGGRRRGFARGRRREASARARSPAAGACT